MTPGARANRPPDAAALFAGRGEMRARCLALDWAATPLGPVATWPPGLRTTVATVLAGGFPGVVLWGPELVQLYNDGYVPFLGAKHPAGLGMPTHACWPDLRDVTAPLYARVLAGETVTLTDQRFALRRRGPDAPPDDVDVTLAYVPVPEDAGGARAPVGGILVTLFDTTSQVRARALEAERGALLAAERAAREEADAARAAAEANGRRLAAVIAHLPVGVTFAEGPGGRHSVSNPAAAAIWGRVPASPGVAAYSRDFVGFRPGPGAPGSAEEAARRIASDEWPLARALVRGEVVHDELAEIERPDGTRRLVSLSAAPVRDADGRVDGALVTTVDVTERERLLADAQAARAEAEAANRAKSQFLAVMSHELRTPLNAIGGYAELIELGIRGPVTDQQREDLGRIQRSQRHLLGLVNEVLNYARLETGAVRYEVADVRVCDALAAAEGLIAPQAHARGLTLKPAACPSDLAVRADPEKLRQVLVNLLSNAVKFTDPGGRIAVDCADDPAHPARVAIRVRDTGIGIAAGQLARIFEPFVQVRADLTRTAEGAGLGLAISRDLARGMGGDLTAESSPGEGSTFTVTLPRA